MVDGDPAERSEGGGERPARRGIVVRGALLVLGAIVAAIALLFALTYNVLERQQAWCDDCPDLGPEVYASDDRYLAAVVLLGITAIGAALVGLAVAAIRRSGRGLVIGALVTGALLLLAAGATALHWLLY